MAKKLVLPIIIVVLLTGIIYQIFLKKEKPTFTLFEVVRGKITQEVSETGQVKKGEKINLGFKNTGRIEEIYVEVGDEVESGQKLAKLETAQLQIQLQEAKAVFKVSQAKLEKLLAGSTPEEIQAAETSVTNARVSLKDAQQNLKDVKAEAEEDLDSAYEDALNVLDDAYLKAYNSQVSVESIQRTYFNSADQESIKVKENKGKIETAVLKIKSSLAPAKTDSSQENINLALSQIKDELSNVSNALKVIREICQEPNYLNAVSSADKSSLDTHRKNINTALSDVIDSQQTISSTKLTNESNINAAQAKVSKAEGEVLAAEDQLSLIAAPPRQEDIDLYTAEKNQTQAKVNLLENQLIEAVLKSPIKGQLAKINKRAGEVVQTTEVVVSLLPDSPFQIKVDIYEEDIVKIKVGNPVDISLVAIPNQTFKGEVSSIDPAEKLIEGVVYYEVTVVFDKVTEGIKPGMTADLTIKTFSRENVLTIPEDAIQKEDGRTIVQVFEEGLVKEKEIEIGLLGSENMAEVISGLNEGEKIILPR